MVAILKWASYFFSPLIFRENIKLQYKESHSNCYDLMFQKHMKKAEYDEV